MSNANQQDRRVLHRRAALRTVVFYTIIACLWIYFSDTLLALFISDPDQLTRAQTIKGSLYVVVTAALLYLYLNHCLQSLRTREEEIETEKDRAQAEIQSRFRQLNTLFDSMNAVVYVADLKTYELLYVNRFAENYFGKKWQGKKCYHYLQAGIEQPCDFCTNPMLLKSGETGEPIIWEFLNSKTQRWFECFDKAIQWTDGRLVRLEVALDVTERKELEKIKDDLLSSMSHEMRTPLTAISGFAELLMDAPEIPDEQNRHIKIILREAEKLAELVNRFLDVRRLKIDRSRIDYANHKMAPLLRRAQQSCRDCAEHHDIQIECPDDIVVFGNRKEIIQVITQLLENACRFSPKGGAIVINVSSTPEEIVTSITDHGIGIPHHELESIFQPFHRLDTGDRRTTGGVGLGLSVAREIISLHGGYLDATSIEGQGSTFTIRLPQTADLQTDSDNKPGEFVQS